MLKAMNCPFCGAPTCVLPLDGGPGIGIDSYYVKCVAWDCNAQGPSGSAMAYFKSVDWSTISSLPTDEIEEIARNDAIVKWNTVCEKLETKDAISN